MPHSYHHMYDELTFRLHQLRVWIELDWWGTKLIEQYPLSSGLVIGVVVGYYAEPVMDYIEALRARRAMRKKLRNKRK